MGIKKYQADFIVAYFRLIINHFFWLISLIFSLQTDIFKTSLSLKINVL